jgi:hypothetical protein
MTYEDYVRRQDFYNERLRAVDLIIDRFCARRGGRVRGGVESPLILRRSRIDSVA